MKYGLPYKGSKNKLAERIVRLLPEADHLIDLFCGGCAVSHAALLRGKWPHVHVNDADWRCPELFVNALQGKYADERRWVSREDFERLKLSDPYVACVWSFGNNMRNYLYSRDLEPLKRAVHYAVFFADYAPAVSLGHDLSFLSGIDGAERRYSAVRRYFAQTAIGGGDACKTRSAECAPCSLKKKTAASCSKTSDGRSGSPGLLTDGARNCRGSRAARSTTPRQTFPRGASSIATFRI